MCQGFARDVTNQNHGKKGWGRDRSRPVGSVTQGRVESELFTDVE